jgi:hypothetical protein
VPDGVSGLTWVCEPIWGGVLEYLHPSPARSRRRRKGNPMPGGITRPLCHWGTLTQITDPPGWGLESRLTTLFCKRNIVAKSKEVKSGCNLAVSSKEGYGSKSAVLPMMMMIIIIIIESHLLPTVYCILDPKSNSIQCSCVCKTQKSLACDK